MSPENNPIETRLDQFRAEKKGSAKADVITPLRGLEDLTFSVVRTGESVEPTPDDIDGGWKVSAASEEDGVTLFKPEVNADGELHVKTKTIPTTEFIAAQDIADKLAESGSNATPATKQRIIQVNAIMDKMRSGQTPDWNPRDDIK